MIFLLLILISCAACTATKVAQEAEGSSAESSEPPVNPLTGEEVASWDSITRRPLAVKVENDPRARPQSGIVDADLVYEELVEGGVTRFICIYLSREPPVIGPNRSARPSDVDICYYLNPLLACSGGERTVVSTIRASGMKYIEEDTTHFWRDHSRRAPHNLYTSSALLRQYLAESGDIYNSLPISGLVFAASQESVDEAEATGGEDANGEDAAAESVISFPATHINVPYKMTTCAASYQYDAASDSYLHSINGVAHTDLTTGARVAPRNVIVQTVKLSGSGIEDVTGAETPVSRVIGSGNCLIFTGGKVYHATWKKENRSSPCRFVDSNDNPVPLKPGQTWIHLVSADIGATYQ